MLEEKPYALEPTNIKKKRFESAIDVENLCVVDENP